MRRRFTTIFFIVFSFMLQATVISGQPMLHNKEIDKNESLFKIANGFLELGDIEKSFYYAKKICNYGFFLRFHYNAFEKFFSEGDIKSAITQLEIISLDDTLKFGQINQPFRNSYLYNGVGLVVDYYLNKNKTEIALNFAKDYDDLNSISYIYYEEANKHIAYNDFDKALSYIDSLTQNDKDTLLKEASIKLVLDNQFDRGMEVCSKIEDDDTRDFAYMAIFKEIPINGNEESFRKQLSFLTKEKARKNFTFYYAISSAECGLYEQAEQLSSEIDDLRERGLIYNKILENIMENDLLEKAIEYYFDHSSNFYHSHLTCTLIRKTCEKKDFEIAFKIAGSDSSRIKKDSYYSTIAKCYLKDDNLKQVYYILDNFIEDPKEIYMDLCGYYCDKDDFEKAASYTQKFTDTGDIDRIYRIIILNLRNKDRFDEALKYVNLVSQEHLKKEFEEMINNEINKDLMEH